MNLNVDVVIYKKDLNYFVDVNFLIKALEETSCVVYEYWTVIFYLVCQTTLSGDLSSSGVDGPLIDAS